MGESQLFSVVKTKPEKKGLSQTVDPTSVHTSETNFEGGSSLGVFDTAQR